MNKKIGVAGALLNTLAVAGFALSMLVSSLAASYLCSMLIAFSFVPMIAALCHNCPSDRRVAGNCAQLFGAVYVVLILAVYFAQLTTVKLGGLNEQAAQILDYSQFGLFFSYDLLGYGLMALSTFFAGLTIRPDCRADKWLKALLLIHGVFFVSCLLLPMLGIFHPGMEGAEWIGTAVLEFWCLYFIPVGVLAMFHLKRRQ